MLRLIKALVSKYKAQRKYRAEVKAFNLRRKGYAYAYRLLHLDKDAEKKLQKLVDSSRAFGEYNNFDAGIEQCLKHWRDW